MDPIDPTPFLAEVPPLLITTAALDRIQRFAWQAGRDECVGLLASPWAANGPEITAALLLPARTSPVAAEAAPLAIRKAAQRLRHTRHRPRGLFHSHAAASCFHSFTDRETILRLLPAMAAWNFASPPGAVRVPRVTGPDTAELPAPGGGAWQYTLQGPPLASADAFATVAWAGVETHFGAPGSSPRAIHDGRRLRLEAGGVSLVLHLPPDGVTLQVQEAHRAGLQMAVVFSLVVNHRGEHAAAALVILDWNGRSLLFPAECNVQVVRAGQPTATPRLATVG